MSENLAVPSHYAEILLELKETTTVLTNKL